MKLFLVHCGFYDPALQAGTTESHVNFFLAAATAKEARSRAKSLAEFRRRRMHIDGLQEILAVDGFAVQLRRRASLAGKTLISLQKYGSRGAKLHTL